MAGGLAIVTGASTGIGRELARLAAADGYELIVAANEPGIHDTARGLPGGAARAVECDLATAHGVEELWSALDGRTPDVVMANAGRGLGDAFLTQDWDRIEEVIHLNVTGTTAVVHRAARSMAAAGRGRILITGSIAGLMPGSFQAVYNATKAYLDTLSWGIREELKDHGVSVTCLQPGPVDTEFFDRADMNDTPVGKDDDKYDPKMVAEAGYRGMMKGHSGVTPGVMNAIQARLSGIVPDEVLARMHRRMAEPEGRP